VRAGVRACHRHDDGNSHVAIAEPSRVRLHRAREVCIFLSHLYIREEITVVKWQNVSVSLQPYIVCDDDNISYHKNSIVLAI